MSFQETRVLLGMNVKRQRGTHSLEATEALRARAQAAGAEKGVDGDCIGGWEILTVA